MVHYLLLGDALGLVLVDALGFVLVNALGVVLVDTLLGPRSHHKGATCRVRTGDQRYPILCHCQLGQDIPYMNSYMK